MEPALTGAAAALLTFALGRLTIYLDRRARRRGIRRTRETDVLEAHPRTNDHDASHH